MKSENIVEDNNNNNKLGKETLRMPSRKTEEEQKQEFARAESSKNEFLKEQGIELLSDEKVAKMSFGEVLSYQVDMRNKIFEVQNGLPPKDFDASRVIFDEALSRLNTIGNPNDLQRLKKQFGLTENFSKPEVKKNIPKITKEDSKYFDMDIDNPELLKWLKDKEIEFDKGVIEVEEEDGTIRTMQTNKEDFGTFGYDDEKK